MAKRSEYAKAMSAVRKFEKQIDKVSGKVKGPLVRLGKTVMRAMKVHETERYSRYRIRDPEKFDPRSFRIIDPGRPGHTKMVIGCPKGFFKSGRCKVGTVVQAVLKEK